jgi:hypothetical protein
LAQVSHLEIKTIDQQPRDLPEFEIRR